MTDFIKTPGCTKTTTKCLYWYGGKLYCIDACDGEPIEKVICKIDSKLKSLFELFSISELSLDAVVGERECPPEKLKDVVQLILNKLESSQDNTGTTLQEMGLIPVPPAFQSSLGTEPVPMDNYLSFLGSLLAQQASTIQGLTAQLATLTQNYATLSAQVSQIISG